MKPPPGSVARAVVRASRARSIRREFEVRHPTVWMDTIGECHEIMLPCDNWGSADIGRNSCPVECKKMTRDFYFSSMSIAALFAAGSVGRGPLDGRV